MILMSRRVEPVLNMSYTAELGLVKYHGLLQRLQWISRGYEPLVGICAVVVVKDNGIAYWVLYNAYGSITCNMAVSGSFPHWTLRW